MRRILAITYLGLITGFLVLLLLNCSVWLEMRINTSLALPIFTLTGFVFSLVFRRKVPPSIGLVLQVAVLLLFLLKYGIDSSVLSIMPAILLREGYHLIFLDIRIVNILLSAIIFLGNLSALAGSMNEPSRNW